MSGYYRTRGSCRAACLAAVVGIVAVATTGCTNFKQAIGIEHTSPDEFAVDSRAPLSLPPEFDLRPPAPGATRPQEPPTNAQARAALDSAGPGKPGEQQPPFALTGQGGLPQLRGPQSPNGEAQGDAGNLAGKLLDAGDTGNAGAAVEKRETTPLKGVY
jgi:hypothetical protein